MGKIYLGIIFTLSLVVVLLSWRYSAVLEELGGLEQANQQLVSALKTAEQQNRALQEQQKTSADISAQHHEKTLSILKNEQQIQNAILQHKITQLQKRLQQNTGSKPVNREEKNEKSQQTDCADTVIPEFYLKQL